MNLTLLERLIEEDYGYTKSRRWGRSEKHSSLVVDSDKQVFFFNAKGIVGSTLDYLIKVRGMSYRSAKEFLLTQPDYVDSYIHHHIDSKEIITYPPLVDSFYEIGKHKRDYFYERGITDESIERFKLGYYNGWFTVPIYEDLLLRNIQLRRDIPSKRISKYYKGMGASLFNADILKVVKEVYYVEGPIDAIAINQNEGLPVVSSDSGGGFDTRWFTKFAHITKINLVFDNDSAGEKEAQRVSKLLGTTRCKIYTFKDFKIEAYDPVDYYKDGNSGLAKLVKEKGRFGFELL